MSENVLKNDQSNEEIIEEITRNLAESAINDTSTRSSDIPNTDSGQENTTGTKVPEEDPWSTIGRDEDEETETTKTSDLPDDFVDEEALKDREVDLTEDQREALRKTSEDLKNEGNRAFKEGEYKKAMELYTKGLNVCPLAFDKDRSILYANRAASKNNYLDNKDSVIADCTKAVELNPNYLKAYVRRAQLYEQTEKLDEALEDYKKILTFDPAHKEANEALRRLPPLIAERNEKLKTEMLGKLKDLGNLVLRPFGLSTDNFELKQDPKSGGYSVNFNQGPR